MEEKNPPIITKKILLLGFTAPFILGVGGMLIAYFATKNLSERIRAISMVVATFLGLSVSIGLIFLMQWYIKRKIKRAED